MKLSPRPVLSLALLGAFAVGAGLAGCTGDNVTSVLSMKVGDCLNDAQDDGTVQSVPVVDCAEPHDSEVFAVFDATSSDDAIPSADKLETQADEGCDAAFADFIGLAYGDSAYSYASYTPTASSWGSEGGKAITCVVFDPEGKTTGTLEGVGA